MIGWRTMIHLWTYCHLMDMNEFKQTGLQSGEKMASKKHTIRHKGDPVQAQECLKFLSMLYWEQYKTFLSLRWISRWKGRDDWGFWINVWGQKDSWHTERNILRVLFGLVERNLRAIVIGIQAYGPQWFWIFYRVRSDKTSYKINIPIFRVFIV